ncbi:MAG: TIGR02710 family CRISPR-associated CARF protein [Desulfotomaculales bacterium]
MPCVLVISVGGSCEPVVNACRDLRPDFIYFFCSGGFRGSSLTVDGPGDPCGDTRKAIVYQLGLRPDAYTKIEVADPDDLNACYKAVREVSAEITARFGPGAEVIANYTGGTKTMSVALALFAIIEGNWKLTLNKGPRCDLVKVRVGDIPVSVDKQVVALTLLRNQAREFLKRYAYEMADTVLAEATGNQLLSGSYQDELLRARRLCQAFHFWDIFDHARALELLRAVGGKRCAPFIEALLSLTGERRATGYELVIDLTFNARRRAEQGRYDDCVARLYRALEMLAQVRLQKEWGIETGNVELAKLPEHLHERCNRLADTDGRIRLPLKKAYDLLADLDDTVGRLWQENQQRLLAALEGRNSSILAHGVQPLHRENYEAYATVMEDFIWQVLETLGVKTRCHQLPREELLEM